MTELAPGEARILDRGYRHYGGERSGLRGSIRTLALHSVQRALGLRRTTWAKVLPIGAVLIAYLPAVVFVGVVALVPLDRLDDNFLPTYGDYYTFIISAIMLFVAFVAPEVLCTDRRTGMLGVYLSSPLDRDSYLVGKAIAIASVLALVCIGPPLLLLVANVLQSQGPDGAGDILLTLVRVLGAGVMVTLLFTGITMGVASLTDRKAVATAAIILLFLLSIMVTGILVGTGNRVGLFTLAPTWLALDLASRVHGERGQVMASASSALLWGAWAIWTFGGFALARYRLHAAQVTR